MDSRGEFGGIAGFQVRNNKLESKVYTFDLTTRKSEVIWVSELLFSELNVSELKGKQSDRTEGMCALG